MLDFNKEMEIITGHDLKDRHSYFQLQHFLVGKEPTIQSKLWRCIKELKSRKESLLAVQLEIDDANDDLELINIKIGEIAETAETDAKQKIRLRKLNRKITYLADRINSLNNKKESIEEESKFFIDSYHSLIKIEPLRHQDDLTAQKNYWNEKLGQEMNLRLLFNMPLDLELLKTILALNSDSPIKKETLKLMESIQNNINNLQKKEQDKIAAPMPLSANP